RRPLMSRFTIHPREVQKSKRKRAPVTTARPPPTPYMRFALPASLVERELSVFAPKTPPAAKATAVAPTATQRKVCDFSCGRAVAVKPGGTLVAVRETAGTARESAVVAGLLAGIAATASGLAAGCVVESAGEGEAAGGVAVAVGFCAGVPQGAGEAAAAGGDFIGNEASGAGFTPVGGPFFACFSFACSSSISFSARFTEAVVWASGFSRRYDW